MKKINKHFWAKSNHSVNNAYCYSFVYNNLYALSKDTDIFNLRIFYKL